MSKMTGIHVGTPAVVAIYDRVRQAMPVQTNIGGFISSQQMGITQLAFEYCSVLVDDTSERQMFWPDFPWGTSKATAFNDRAAVVDPLLAGMVGLNIPTQPDTTAVTAEVNSLIDELIVGSGTTDAIMKGACASVLGSAAMLVQ